MVGNGSDTTSSTRRHSHLESVIRVFTSAHGPEGVRYTRVLCGPIGDLGPSTWQCWCSTFDEHRQHHL